MGNLGVKSMKNTFTATNTDDLQPNDYSDTNQELHVLFFFETFKKNTGEHNPRER